MSAEYVLNYWLGGFFIGSFMTIVFVALGIAVARYFGKGEKY